LEHVTADLAGRPVETADGKAGDRRRNLGDEGALDLAGGFQLGLDEESAVALADLIAVEGDKHDGLGLAIDVEVAWAKLDRRDGEHLLEVEVGELDALAKGNNDQVVILQRGTREDSGQKRKVTTAAQAGGEQNEG
jgi:hypothetical protein